MKTQFSSLGLMMLTVLATSCGGAKAPAASANAVVTPGSSVIGTPAMAGLPSDAVMLVRLHGVESAWKIGRGWAGEGPASPGDLHKFARAVDWEQGMGLLVTVDRNADLDKVMGGTEPMPVHFASVVAVQDISLTEDMIKEAKTVSPGRRRFVDEDDKDFHTRLQCDVQSTGAKSALIVCGDEVGMKTLYAAATTSLMAVHPAAQLHVEFHKDNAQPLLDNGVKKLKALASLVSEANDMLAAYSDTLAVFDDMSDIVFDTQLDSSGLRMEIAEDLPRESSSQVKALMTPVSEHLAKNVFHAWPAEALTASYGEHAHFAGVASIFGALKKSWLKEASRYVKPSKEEEKKRAAAADYVTEVAKRLTPVTQVAVVCGIEAPALRNLVGKLTAAAEGKPNLSSADVPVYGALWHNGPALLLAEDLKTLKTVLAPEKGSKKKPVVELAPAKGVPQELAGATIFHFADKPVSKLPLKKGEEPAAELYLVDMPFMSGRVLAAGMNLPTIAATLRRTASSGDKISGIKVFKENTAAGEIGFGYLRTDLLSTLTPILAAGKLGPSSANKLKMLTSTASLLDALQQGPRKEVTEMANALQSRRVKAVIRIPADVFVQSANLVRAADHHDDMPVEPALQAE